jgi:hypothetical protein
MAYKLNTLDQNIITALWRNGGMAPLEDLKSAAPDLGALGFRMYVHKLAKKSRMIDFIDLRDGELPTFDTVAQLDTETYAMWVA